MEHPERHHPHGRGKRLTTDDRLRNELALCRQYRIPHSQFRGVGDGTWTERDRAKALAYEEWTRSACPQCGTRESDWVDDEGEYTDAYVALTHKCFGCEEIAAKQSEIPEGKAGAGMKVLLLPTSVHAAQQLFEELTAR
ncbi:hypothetical protein [Streptomyces pseudovenezuelae]|uniref:hypothetical protein n=1 Tax=Streptomyces pseudovenezuelae TaxID=67350 RepID=UPI002E81C4DF|nr:hypothetical protein [Streptomyces pseudovenezuelae]WUA94441.1 hypothetical protein OHO81_45190 [Streptomyces pseudovenezuelae]